MMEEQYQQTISRMESDFQTARLNLKALAFSPLLSPDERDNAIRHLVSLLKELLNDAEGYA